jgi:membrane-bound lytic murein transglycosylase D
LKSFFYLFFFCSAIANANINNADSGLYASIAKKQVINNSSFKVTDQELINQHIVNLKKIGNSTPLIRFYIGILQQENIPVDFAILPIIESGNNPKARSQKNALGLWQFMPDTAFEYNLTESDFNDDRTDVLKSTYAAVMYLKYLYSVFNDWNLVLAAYNWGPTNVKKALNKGLYNEQGEFNLNKLPAETKKYLVSFHAYNQAIKNRFNDPILSQYPDSEYILKIDHEKFSSYLSQNPDIASVSTKVLEHMNGFNVYTSPSKNFILVPTTIFKNYFSLNEISFKNRINLATNKIYKPKQCIDYQTQYNDTFNSIAEKQSINIKDLRDYNPSVRFIRPNIKLNICYG